MIFVRAASREEIKELTSDPLTPLSVARYAAERDGVVLAYFGVASASSVGTIGWPWFHPVRMDLISRKELVRFARAALSLWAEEYNELWACSEEGKNEAWFRFLGFEVDRKEKPVYAYGKTMVFMRYAHGRSNRHKA